MGMFDELKCEYPLGHPPSEGLTFQTKSMDCNLDKYRIDKNGALWIERYDIEDRSDPNAKGVARLFGSLSRVNKREERLSDFSGEIDFYMSYGEKKSSGFGECMVEFRAQFLSGQLQSVCITSDFVPEREAANREAEALQKATETTQATRNRRI